MKASKRFIMAGLAGMSILFAAGVSQAAEAAKVRVCHEGRVLIVSANAVNSHVGHGDPSVFVAYEDGSCKIASEEKPSLAPETPPVGEEKPPVM